MYDYDYVVVSIHARRNENGQVPSRGSARVVKMVHAVINNTAASYHQHQSQYTREVDI